MRVLILRVLVLASLLLMPFGMATARVPLDHEAMAAAMQHCPEPASSHHGSGALADCTMACASALPAAPLELAAAHPRLQIMPDPMPVAALSGIELEIATPPPRGS